MNGQTKQRGVRKVEAELERCPPLVFAQLCGFSFGRRTYPSGNMEENFQFLRSSILVGSSITLHCTCVCEALLALTVTESWLDKSAEFLVDSLLAGCNRLLTL